MSATARFEQEIPLKRVTTLGRSGPAAYHRLDDGNTSYSHEQGDDPDQRHSRSASVQKRDQTTSRQRLGWLGRFIPQRLINARLLLFIKDWRQSWEDRRDAPEQAKSIRRNDWAAALLSCWVHVLPLCATVVLAGLQIHTFYIGETLEGFIGTYSDTFKQLGLQITAKILVSIVHPLFWIPAQGKIL